MICMRFLYNNPTLSKYLVYKRALKTYKNHIIPPFLVGETMS